MRVNQSKCFMLGSIIIFPEMSNILYLVVETFHPSVNKFLYQQNIVSTNPLSASNDYFSSSAQAL